MSQLSVDSSWYYSEGVCSNFANMFAYSLNIFFEKELFDYIIRIPLKYKKDGHFNLLVTKLLDEELLDVPYFSHERFKNFDGGKMMLIENKPPQDIRIKTMLLNTRIGPYLSNIKHMLQKLLRSKNTEYKQASIDIISNASFEEFTGIDITSVELKKDNVLYELPGWALMIWNALRGSNISN